MPAYSKSKPYLAGASIGILSCFAFYVTNEPLGVTTPLSHYAGLAAIPLIGQEAVAHNTYWNTSPLDWGYGIFFLLGIPLGAFLSSMLAGNFKFEYVPEFWRKQMGNSVAKRFLAAFLGGSIMMFGARLADGCTSGHGISGALQLALSSWVFILVLFITTPLISAFLFRKG